MRIFSSIEALLEVHSRRLLLVAEAIQLALEQLGESLVVSRSFESAAIRACNSGTAAAENARDLAVD
jgi:hypothetical protein